MIDFFHKTPRILWPQKSGPPGLSVGDMCHKPLILEIAASALGFPACIAVLEATRAAKVRARKQLKGLQLRNPMVLLYFYNLLQKTFGTNIKKHALPLSKNPSLIGALEQMRLPMDGHSVEKLYCTKNIFSETFDL